MAPVLAASFFLPPILVRRDHVHRYSDLLLARPQHHAADRGDVGVVTACGEHDVIARDDQGVGGVEADPAQAVAAPEIDPGCGYSR